MSEVKIDGRSLKAAEDATVRKVLSASTAAVGAATRTAVEELRQATQRAVPGKLFRSWSAQSFPKNGPAREPVGILRLNDGRDASASPRTLGAIASLVGSGAMRRGGGKFYAVPLPAAGTRGRNRNLTPTEWEARTGLQLRPVFRPGRLPLLVTDNARLSGGRQVAKVVRSKRAGPAARGTATIPIFVLIPTIKLRGGLAIEPIVQRARGRLPQLFTEALRSGER